MSISAQKKGSAEAATSLPSHCSQSPTGKSNMNTNSTAAPDGARATDFSQYRNGGIFQIDLLHADFLTKKTEWEMSVGPDDDLDVDSAQGLASEEAAQQLVFFPCRTMGEVARKAQAIRANMWLSDVAASRIDEFLASFVPAGRAHK